MEEQYKRTAMGWANSPHPSELAKVMDTIYNFSRSGTPAELLQVGFDQLLLNTTDPTLNACGLNLISHLVSSRWDDLSDQDKHAIYSNMARIMAGAAVETAWSTKNKAARLVSQLVEKQGASEAWGILVAAYMAYFSCDATKADSTILTCILEGISTPDDQFKAERLKDLKSQNWDWLMEALFLLLDKHAKMYNTYQGADGQKHSDLIMCIAKTAAVYARWGEAKNLLKGAGGMDLIDSCAILLNSDALLHDGIIYLSEICARVQPAECDDGVLEKILNHVLGLLESESLPEGSGFRKAVCASLVSVRQSFGTEFDRIKEDVFDYLKTLKANGCITETEYDDLRVKVCDDTNMIG